MPGWVGCHLFGISEEVYRKLTRAQVQVVEDIAMMEYAYREERDKGANCVKCEIAAQCWVCGTAPSHEICKTHKLPECHSCYNSSYSRLHEKFPVKFPSPEAPNR